MSKDTHHFNIEIAQNYGVDVAIFLDNISYWLHLNSANARHYHDGRYWTRNDLISFTILFPYWSTRQLERIIKTCIEKGLLLKGNYNKTQYDRTYWYSLTDRGLELLKFPISPNGGMEKRERGNRITQTVTPIPDTNSTSDINTKESIESTSKPKAQNRSRKNSSPNLTTYNSNFFPDNAAREALTIHAQRTNNTENELFEKFERVMIKYKTRSADWQLTFIKFLEDELPKRSYEDEKGQKRRYDNKSMHY